MNTKAVNYDQIAPTYNRRFDGEKSQPILIALLELVRQIQARTILEVGCGTGFWLAGVQEAPTDQVDKNIYGLDLSTGMLRQARLRPNIMRLVLGQAEALPFGPASFDLIYCVHALHHFIRQQDFVTDCLRWLKPGGTLAVIGSDPHNHSQSGRRGEWYVYEYFDGVLQTDLARFPSWGQVMNWMVGAGYETVTWQPVEILHDTWRGAKVFADPFLKKDATSQLMLLSEAAYQTGLDKLHEAITAAQTTGVEIKFHSVIHVDMLLGNKTADQRKITYV